MGASMGRLARPVGQPDQAPAPPAPASPLGGRPGRRLPAGLGIGLVVAASLQVACHQAILTAPPGSTIAIFANPTFIPAHGGVSVISALVIEPAGTPVPDGTVVQFFTSLGLIDEQGRTNDGVARVNLVSDSRSGNAEVTAYSGAVQATLDGGVDIGSALPARLLLTANPSRITDSRATWVTANVFDDDGNPVFNVPVFFTVVNDPSLEWMDSGGRPVHTDTNGRAEDVMRTRRASSGTAKVRAETPSPGAFVYDEVDVAIVR